MWPCKLILLPCSAATISVFDSAPWTQDLLLNPTFQPLPLPPPLPRQPDWIQNVVMDIIYRCNFCSSRARGVAKQIVACFQGRLLASDHATMTTTVLSCTGT